MAGTDSGSGVGGSSFTHYNYPGIYQTQVRRASIFAYLCPHVQDFHHCGSSGDDIQNYNDAYQVQNCELVNLAE